MIYLVKDYMFQEALSNNFQKAKDRLEECANVGDNFGRELHGNLVSVRFCFKNPR